MTKLRVLSDLHLEFGPLDLAPAGEDALVLAGDIGLHVQGAEWALTYGARHGVPVVMIAGNHEFYRHRGDPRPYTIASTLAALWKLAAHEQDFYFLEDAAATVAGVTFLGCTLWTDYALNGNAPLTMRRAALGMNDYRLIYETPPSPVTPANLAARHAASRAFLERRLPHDAGPTVVLTHHLPSPRSIDGRYADTAINACYASDLDELVAGSGAALWVHGHTHASADYLIGGTRILCNPRGYTPHDLNPSFDPDLIVEV